MTTATAGPITPPALTAIATPSCGPLFSTVVSAAPSNCYLPSWEQYLEVGYYSPGICPSGYYPACSAAEDVRPPVRTDVGEKAYYCAPR